MVFALPIPKAFTHWMFDEWTTQKCEMLGWEMFGNLSQEMSFIGIWRVSFTSLSIEELKVYYGPIWMCFRTSVEQFEALWPMLIHKTSEWHTGSQRWCLLVLNLSESSRNLSVFDLERLEGSPANCHHATISKTPAYNLRVPLLVICFKR